jgi:hypothetical protein
MAHTGWYIREFTNTPYPTVGEWIRRAGEADRPVRFNNAWVGYFYAQVYGVEMLTGDGRWIEADAPGQAVLIFENQSPPNLTRAGYTIEAADVSAQMDSWYPTLTSEGDIPRHVELWWPSGPSAPLRPEGPLPQFVQYFPGEGCVTPLPYGDGTLHFYQLVLDRLLHGRGS